jgi:hypothetical protein
VTSAVFWGRLGVERIYFVSGYVRRSFGYFFFG